MVNIIKTFRPVYRIDHKPSRVVRVLCLLFIGLFYLTAAINTANAATYYVDDANGSDSDLGTSWGAAWKTMKKPPAVASGDTIWVKNGTYAAYEETLTSNRTNWITYRAAPGHQPVIKNIAVTAWHPGYNAYLRFQGFKVQIPVTWYTEHVYSTSEPNNWPANPYSYPTYQLPSFPQTDNVVSFINAHYVDITDCVILGIHKNLTTYGVRFYNSNNSSIEHCDISLVNSPITTLDCNDISIQFNQCHDFYGSGIGCKPSLKSNRLMGKTTIAYNHIYDQPEETYGGAYNYQESHQGSAIAIRVAYTSVRNNIIHNIFGQGLKFYSDEPDLLEGYTGMTVENNLFYDVNNPLCTVYALNGPCVIRNNTIIAAIYVRVTTWAGIPDKYGAPAAIAMNFISSFDGTGVELYNNIVVGNYNLVDPCDPDLHHTEDYNIFWKGYYPTHTKKGNNTFLAYWYANGYHGYPEYFEDITDLAAWTPEYPEGSTPTPFFVNPGFDTRYAGADHAETWDYHLAPGSPGINFGDPANQPSDSLGTIGPDGFIRNDGPPRDANYHSAGCYEYSPIDPNNPPPELQAIGDKSVDENSVLTFDVNATDPNGEPITYSAQSLPSGATLDPQTGDFAWTPSYNQAGSYQVTFRASDGNSWDSETITITVNNVNRPPVIGSIIDQSVNENGILSLSVNASDPDGQALTYSISGLPAGAVFVSQTLTWTPSYDQAGSYPVTFTVDDGQAQDSEAITITVINVNRTPVLTAINNQSVWADDPLTFTIDATDPDGDTVTYSVGTLPSGATFIGQDFDWTPSQGQMGSYDVTFIASDGQLQDSEIVTITVDVDSLAPTVTNSLPTAGSIQVPLNNLITLNVTDAGKGIEPKSVKIKVKTNSNPNNNTVYFGDMDHYISLLGDCRRIGSNADYKFVFQPTQDLFYYDQTVTITVNATDLAGNVMDEYSYSFATEMHSFGQNKQVNSGLDNNDRPVTVCDSSGNIWTAWHTGSIGNRDIYVSKLAAGEENFGGTVQLTDNTNDQCNPAVALDSNDKLYVVWQDNRQGDWDIYVSTSVDGISWSTEIRVNDPNEGNQVNPAIVIDGQSPNQAHVVWQDDRAGNQDICIATSSNGFIIKTISQITSDASDQVEPAVTADSDDTIYVVWTDGRNGSNDIYGAASNNPWTNVAIVSNANNQSSPTIAAESVGSILHLLWVDDTLGDKDIYYASSNGLPGSPLTGSSIIDDTSGADQLDPAIAVTGSTGNNLKVFACWQDWRNTDTDLYFAELSSSSGTNVFVGDGGSSTYQGEPVIGIDEYSHPYLIWADNRSTNTEIYYAGSTFVEPVALASELVIASASSSTTVGADPQAITTVDDVSVVVPAGACSYDVAITVTKIANPQTFAAPCLGGYDFGPSGIQFSQPVTITIPYVFAGSDSSATPYWFNALSGNLSQQGITGVQDIVISPTLHALSFKTTHFTAFYLLGGGAAAAIGLGGGGGGGCSVSAGGEGNMVEFVLPYIGLVVVMAILKVRDARERKARST